MAGQARAAELGLGLALVPNVVRLQGGSFALVPGPGGVGLQAVVELPLTA